MKQDPKRIAYLLIAAGVLLRVVQWLYNRTLWVDEAMLGLNIVESGFVRLLQPLRYEQVAPILFLWIEKSMVLLLGNNELSLRLFPLICGTLSLWLVYRVAEKATGDKRVALITLLLFAFSRTFVFFSTETKQYSIDLLMALVFYDTLLSDYRRHYVRLLITGAFAVWLSNVGIVMITVTGLFFLADQWQHRKIEWREWGIMAALGSWFVLYFVNFIHGHPSGETMDNYWVQHFMPHDPSHVSFWTWQVQHIVGNFSTFAGVNVHLGETPRAIIGTFLSAMAVAGIIRWYHTENRTNWLPLFVAPVIIHLALAALRLYPFNGRLILYLAPSFLIISTYGAVSLFVRLREYLLIRWFAVVSGAAFLGFVFFWAPIRQEEVKDCIDFVREKKIKTILPYSAAIYPVAYYSNPTYSFKNHQLPADVTVIPTRDAASILNELELQDSAWVIASHKDEQIQEVLAFGHNARQVFNTAGATVILLTK